MPCPPSALRQLLFRSAVDQEAHRRVLQAMPGFKEREGGGWLRFDFCNQVRVYSLCDMGCDGVCRTLSSTGALHGRMDSRLLIHFLTLLSVVSADGSRAGRRDGRSSLPTVPRRQRVGDRDPLLPNSPRARRTHATGGGRRCLSRICAWMCRMWRDWQPDYWRPYHLCLEKSVARTRRGDGRTGCGKSGQNRWCDRVGSCC
jgi:hypothetical protein